MVLPKIVAVGIYDSAKRTGSVRISKKRTTTMFELELPLENGGPIRTETLICAKPGQIRHTKFPFRCLFLHMELGQGRLFEMLRGLPDFVFLRDASHYREIFSRLFHYENSPGYDHEIIMQSLVLDLIYSLGQERVGMHSGGGGRPRRDVVEKALSYIDRHPSEDLSLEKLASVFSLSPIHFHNSFKTAVGKTLREYVEERRIRLAVERMLTTDRTLTQIAFDCGFSSQSYFSFVFKRRMGMTPRQYARAALGRYED